MLVDESLFICVYVKLPRITNSSVDSSRNGGKALQILTRQGIVGRKNCVLFLAGRAADNDDSLLMACLAMLNDFGIGYCRERWESN